jgi:hypothetical protein
MLLVRVLATVLLDTQSRRRGVIIFYAAQRDEIARHVISILNSSLGFCFFSLAARTRKLRLLLAAKLSPREREARRAPKTAVTHLLIC